MLGFLRAMFYGCCEAGGRVEEEKKQEGGRIDQEGAKEVLLAVVMKYTDSVACEIMD